MNECKEIEQRAEMCSRNREWCGVFSLLRMNNSLSAKLESVTENNGKWIKECDDLRGKLEAAERMKITFANECDALLGEREGLQAQIAVMHGALTSIMAHTVRYAKESDTGYLYRTARQAIEDMPVEAAERVQGLVEALEYASTRAHEDVAIFMKNNKDLGKWTFQDELVKRIRDKAKQSLAKYRGEAK